jgi:hypothetical protein
LIENLFGACFIRGPHPNHHSFTLLHIFEKLSGLGSAKHREDQGMGFDEENIGSELAVPLVRQLVDDLGGFAMMLIILIKAK